MNEELKVKTNEMLVAARSLQITTLDQYREAAGILVVVKDLQKQVEATFDPVISQANKAHKTALEAKRKHAAPLLEAEQLIKAQCAAWVESQERARRLAEAELRSKAKEAEEIRLLEEAAALETVDPQAAEALLEQAQNVEPSISLGDFTPKVEGVSYGETWDFEIVDESKIPREYLVLDLVKIRKVVKALKAMTDIPGVRVFARKSVAVKVPVEKEVSFAASGGDDPQLPNW